MQAPTLLWLHIASFVILCYWKSSDSGSGDGILEALAIFSTYVGALLASIVTYRLFFHRLRNFPGPKIAATTKLWHTAKCFDCKSHILLDELHAEYGDFVRTGPTEITVYNPEVKWVMDGPANKCTKPAWYDILLPLKSVHTTRSKKEHDQRRHAWDSALTNKNLVEYEDRIRRNVSLLEKEITKTSGKSVNIAEWFDFFAFDVMGDFAFGKSFNMLEQKAWHHVIFTIRKVFLLVGPFGPVPWLNRIALHLPLPVVREWDQMLKWCSDRMDQQVAAEVDNDKDKNISSRLIQYSRTNKTLHEDAQQLRGDSFTLIVAGSDTVSSTMTHLLYYLTLHPEHTSILRQELSTLPTPYSYKDLERLNHLKGCINEVLRLHPAIPTGGNRDTPLEGVHVAGTYIPGNVTIVAPRYTMGRLEISYEHAQEFIPERWYSRKEMVKNIKHFDPFGIGRYGCAGKKLGLAEISMVFAMLVSKFDLSFAPGTDPDRVWREAKDCFTEAPGPLEVVFTPRNEG